MTTLTNQKVFDQVVVHLLTQNWKSTPKPYYPEAKNQEYSCSYRGHMNGGVQLKCAIGCLIPDELYKPEMEGFGFTSLIVEFPVIRQLFADIDTGFGQALQTVHDTYEAYEWKRELRKVGDWFNLNTSILDRFPYF